MNVVLAAEESAGLRLLEALARGPHRLVAVLAAPPKSNSAGANVWNTARHLGIETWAAEQVKDANVGERLRSERVDILLNAHSLYRISEEVLSAPRLGAFNLHPGPLPRYAGRNVVSWAIFRGEPVHGVTVHRMESEIDAGPIAYQSLFPIEADDTALSLSLKCSREGVALMLRLLDAAAEDPSSIPSVQQDLSQRQYFGRQVPEEGWLSWSWTARRVVDFVRACDYFPFRSPWGHPRTRRTVQELSLVRAHRTGLPCDVAPGTVGESSVSGVLIACQDEWILVSKLLVSGKHVPAQEVLRRGDRVTDT
jgi:methionyl-tRNA formyltransferase